MTAPTCGYCSATAVLAFGKQIYPHREDLAAKMFWRCASCPDGYVGCHPGTEVPLGRMANAELRRAKVAAHDAFDKLWVSHGRGSRSKAYSWLAGQLGIKQTECHIGHFDLEQCQRVVKVCEGLP